jgi:hypothetical protein
MQRIGILVLLLLAACVPADQATRFKNPVTGAVVAACGPFPGMARAVSEAEQGCTQAYEDKGWVKVTGAE